MRSRIVWRSSYAFYLAAIGSSFGLGNLWRFPYVVGSSGGGVFVLLYVVLALMVGLPVLIGELMLGQITQTSSTQAFRKLVKPTQPLGHFIWGGFGWLAHVAAIVLVSYYAVVSGWVFFYFMRFLLGTVQVEPLRLTRTFNLIMDSGWTQYGLSLGHIAVSAIIVSRGLQEGLERWVGTIMPIFAVLLVYLGIQSLSLPGAEQAIRFLFYPKFDNINWESLIQVIGHILFTLSVGMATMTTFGSYLKEDVSIPAAGLRITLLDISISLFSGLIIFPIVFTAGHEPGADPTLLFKTMPVLFEHVRMGKFFGVAFFLCLYLAALGATIGLMEALVSDVVDRKGLMRPQATLGVASLLSALAFFPAFSSSLFRDVQYQGMGLLQILDSVLIQVLLPLVGLGVAIALAYFGLRGQKEKYFRFVEEPYGQRLYKQWNWVLRYFVPSLIAVALLLTLFASH